MPSNTLGFVLAGAAALERVVLRPRRGIVAFGPPSADGTGPAREESIIADAVVSEHHSDDMNITDHPVEEGVSITDHAYLLPATLTLVYGWAAGSINTLVQTGLSGLVNGGLQAMYDKMLRLQRDRSLCDVYTGKRYYTDMLIRSLSQETTKETENALMLRVVMRQIIIVKSQTTFPANAVQANSQATGAVSDQGTKSVSAPANARVAESLDASTLDPGRL